ncbi:MAG: HNH endonuclease signature motif containing protein [Actinomycetia bacterium]|nr:HNH endonuclease signature motif containing protein [Actinomycetes bacterium]
MFDVGAEYRRTDLHDALGGQRQGGINTPRDRPLILLVTGESGTEYGYADGWASDGTFRYYGEGKRGDMTFVRGNTAIRDHTVNGKDLHLFESSRARFLRYLGQMVCGRYELVGGVPDVDGNPRTAIVFCLVPLESVADGHDFGIRWSDSDEVELWEMPVAELSGLATGSAGEEPPAHAVVTTVFRRSRAVRAFVLRRARGSCEACRAKAPFIDSFGKPFLETHHLRRLSDGGPDDPDWVVAVCPNCHRRAHHGFDAKRFNEQLIDLQLPRRRLD